MKLSDEQEELVRNCVEEQELKLKTLSDDLADHLCCVIESGLGKEKSFDQLLDDAMAELAPNGLLDLERKTFFLLNYKRILIMKKVTYLIGFLGAIALSIGFLAKTLHWPGANELFTIGIPALLVFVPLLAFDKYKVAMAQNMSERIKIISAVAAIIFFLIGSLFKFLHLPGAGALLTLSIVVLVVGFIPFLFFSMYKKSVS